MNNFLGNITFRGNRVRTNSDPIPDDKDENMTSQTLECTSNSLPDISEDEDYVKTLKDEIQNLESQLNSAHKEIELLTIENSKLKHLNENLAKKNQIFKKVASNSPIKSNRSTPKKKLITSKQTQTDTIVNQEHDTVTVEYTQKPSTSTSLNDKITQQTCRKKRVCVLSTDNKHKVLNIAQSVLLKDSDEICHYLTPTVGIEQLITGIETKLSDFTVHDYCIILIGSEDFKSTHDYSKIIIHIRDVLSKIKHTNIIICFPTYTYTKNNDIYNWRIETFNNLLYHDIMSHEYAYYLDSNQHLKCDFRMFRKKSGFINNLAMRAIFEDLKTLMNDIECSNTTFLNEFYDVNHAFYDEAFEDDNENNSSNNQPLNFFCD